MWDVGGRHLSSRLLLGTSLYPSPAVMQSSILASETEIITVSLRRQAPESNGGNQFWHLLKQLSLILLPNTAGCRNAREAVTTARMSRELFETNWIKLEVVGDDYNLQPDPFELVEAAKELITDGFEVFPYTTSDLVVAQRLVEAGCKIVMPWAAPIGTGKGPAELDALMTLRIRLPNVILIVDAGLGKPSHAAQVLELGYDAVLLNSAVAHATDPAMMAHAFKLATAAGRAAFEAGLMEQRQTARPSTPIIGTPFWHRHEATP